MTSINDLPDLALAHILLYASEDKLLNWIKGFPSVCRRWQKIMPFLWSKVDELTYQCYGGHPEFNIDISGDDGWHSMAVPDKCSKIIKGFEYIISRCPKSAKLKLDGFCSGESMNAVILVLNSELCSELKRLEVDVNVSIAIDSREVKQFISCFRNLTNLQEIDLVDIHEETENKAVAGLLMKSVLTSCSGTLKNVTFFTEHFIDFEVLNYLTELHNLETVSIDCDIECTYFSDLIAVLARCTDKLFNVNLRFPITAMRNVNDCRNSMLQLARKQIHNLSLCSTYLDSMVGFNQIFSTLIEFKYLNDLTLDTVDLSCSMYSTVLLRLPLIKLNLRNVENLTDAFFNGFKNGLPLLEKLTIMCHGGIRVNTKPSSECLIEFLANCRRLKKIKLMRYFISGNVVTFVRLFHARFHKCATNTAHVGFGSVFKIIVEHNLETISYDDVKKDADNIKKENFCGVKFFLISIKWEWPVYCILFSEYCQ